MEIRTLRYFLAVAREENMTRAAELLHVTQPTLSKALKALEDELGKKLFTRHSFSIALTEEGVLLRDRAEDLITMADKIEREFLSLDDITGGELFFGLAESYQICYLARELRVLKAQYPGLKYHITSGDTEQVTEKLDKGLLDFAVICDAPNGKKYDAIAFPEGDTWGLILPSKDRWQKKRPSAWMISSACRCLPPNRAGRATFENGQETGSPSFTWRAPSAWPITPPCLSGRVWGTSCPFGIWWMFRKAAGSLSGRWSPGWRANCI